MIPLSQSLLLSSYPKAAKAGTAMAMWAMTTLVAPVAGSAAGRLDHRQYLLALDLLHQYSGGHPGRRSRPGRLYRKRESGDRGSVPHRRALAWCLLVVWVGALQIMLDKGKELDWFHSVEVHHRWPPLRPALASCSSWSGS